MQYKYLQNVLLFGLCVAFFIPFVVSESQLYPFITGKNFSFRILTEVLLAIWLIAMIWDKEIRPKFSWIMGSILLFVGAMSVADILSVNPAKSFWSNFERMDGLVTILHLLGYFLVAGSVLFNRKKWSAIAHTSLVSSLVMSVYVFFQLGGKIAINQGGVRVDGTFGNATYLAVFMLFNFFIALFLLAKTYNVWKATESKRSLWFAISYVIVGILNTVVIYFTATRGVILGLIGGVLLTAIIVAIFGKKEPVLRKWSIGALAAVLILIGGFFAIRTTDFAKNSPTLGRFTSLSLEEIKSQGRWFVWPMAVEGIKEKPIFGWGQESFNYVFNEHYDPRMYNQEQWFDRAHNVVLDWFIAGGVVGFLGYMSMFAALLYVLWKNQSLSLVEKAIIVGLTAAYFFQNLFVFDNLFSYVYFFTLLAFVHSENVGDRSVPQWIEKLCSTSFLKKGGWVIVPVLILFLIYSLNIRHISASRALINALISVETNQQQSLERFREAYEKDSFGDQEITEQFFSALSKLLASGISQEQKNELVGLAISKMLEQIEQDPENARLYYFLGNFESRIGKYDDALIHLGKAIELSPRKQRIIQEIGLVYLAKGEFEKGTEYLKQAYDLGPQFSESAILYAIGALHSKNKALAEKLIASADRAAVVSDERLIAAAAGTNNLALAVSIIEERLSLNPNDPSLHFRLSAGYLQLGQRTKAIDSLRKIVTEFPQYKDQAEFYIKEIQAGRNP
jgi:O-antigen ligase/tetratricopeptide (TPR) repeat protein